MISANDSSSANNDYLDPSTRSEDDDDDDELDNDNDNDDCGVKHGLPPKTRYSIESQQPPKTNIKKAHEVLEGIRRLTIIEEPSTEHEDMAKKLYKGMKLKGLIKDRSYHLKSYKKCFIASDAIDFMIQTKMVSSREEAVVVGQLLDTKLELWHHVCDEHDFQDEYLFFRFEQDDEDEDNEDNEENDNNESSANFFTTSKRRIKRNLRRSKIEAIAIKALSSSGKGGSSNTLMNKSKATRNIPLSNSLIIDDEMLENIASCLQDELSIQPHKDCYVATDAIDLMIKEELVKTRDEAIQVGRMLQSPKCNFWYHHHHHNNTSSSQDNINIINQKELFDNDKHMVFKLLSSKKVNNLVDGDEKNENENENENDDEYLMKVVKQLKDNIVIDDRTYHFKTYKRCFVASDVVDYLVVTSNICKTRQDAVRLGQTLQSSKKINLWSHVTDQHKQFKDEYLFFRFN